MRVIKKYNFRGASSFETSLRGKIEFLKHIRGSADALVAMYANQFNELAEITKPINFKVVEDWESTFDRARCCIHSQMNDTLDMVQGSGFLIAGGYILTNRHVIAKGDQMFADIEVTLPGAINIPIEIKVAAELPEQDLALLKATGDMWHQTLSKSACEISETDAAKDDVVWLTGWPSYNKGDDIYIVQGSVVGFAYPENVKMFRITPSIVFGNSGGPVFNELGEVVGIATRGSDIAGAPLNVHNACVPASWIKELVALIE